MNIPDPIEIMDSMMEEQIGLIDGDGNYPCCNCGKKEKAEDMFTISAHPCAPLCCSECVEEAYKQKRLAPNEHSKA